MTVTVEGGDEMILGGGVCHFLPIISIYLFV